jgi:Ca2+-binding EF-hand superfamily protein
LITLKEFLYIIEDNLLLNKVTEEDLKSIFNELDKNKDGVISHSELKTSFKNFVGEEFDDEEIDNILNEIGNEDGIELDKFINNFINEDLI